MVSGEKARVAELDDFGENPEVWCVIVPFELACVKDQADEDKDAPEAPPSTLATRCGCSTCVWRGGRIAA